MQYTNLGNTDCKISLIVLGSMTWGNQNTEAEAWQQLDLAMGYGVNTIDTAEMYSVPANEKTYGLTEAYIGRWLAKRKNRDQLILATKVIGPAQLKYIRENLSLDKRNIKAAVTQSLKRLQTDYIDLYQLHWPSRKTNFFGSLYYQCNDELGVSMLESLEALADLIKEGLIRYIGVSNETAWGVMNFLSLAQKYNLPKIVSVQNPYNLLNRSPEVAMAEVCWREKVSFLPYSPLAFGALTGKYLQETWPEKARLTLFKEFSRYSHKRAVAATTDYVELAKQYGLQPAQMALAFINQQPFVSGNIIGATNLEQLKENIESVDITLTEELCKKIEALDEKHSIPCP